MTARRHEGVERRCVSRLTDRSDVTRKAVARGPVPAMSRGGNAGTGSRGRAERILAVFRTPA